MGRVYRAFDARLKREVALKALAEHYAQAPEFVERFKREVRSVASLNHPNIIRVFDSGEDEAGSPYMAMELAAGGTLKDRIRSTGPLPPREATRIVLQVADALGAAHEAGIVHRDVKPENVLLTEGGDVKVADFGIARATEATAMTHTSMILGTAPYLSPEQARGEPVGPSSDLYSLGVVLYESLTGRTPFGTGEHINPLAIAMKHLNEPAPSPRAASPAVPEALELITLTLMRKRAEERYPDASTLAADLAAFLEGRGPSSTAAMRMASSPEGARTGVLRRAPDPPTRRRRRKVLPLTALVLAAIFALLISSPAQTYSPVDFVERTITSDAQTLDRTSSPVLEAPPGAPRAPEAENSETATGETQVQNPAPQTAARATAEVQTGSASATAAASASPAPEEDPAVPVTEEASATPSASASPAPTEEPGTAPARPKPPASPQVPNVSGPAEDPAPQTPPVIDEAGDVEIPEVEVPDF